MNFKVVIFKYMTTTLNAVIAYMSCVIFHSVIPYMSEESS